MEASQASTNLAAETTPFVGRGREAQDLAALVRSGTDRLVTVIGPGGVGKTRLARRVAATVIEEFADGAWIVSLGSVAGPEVADAAARALELEPGSTAEDVAEALASRKLLLVLDSCEHVVAEVAMLVDAVLRRSAGTRILGTSRVSLGLEGERVWGLPPLRDEDAAELFRQRSVMVSPSFALGAANAGPVAELCRRLDRLPLAVELAAAWTPLLTPTELVGRLDDRFALLGADDGDRSLRAVVATSWDLLGDGDRAALAALSVFAGAFDVAAAAAVVGGTEVEGLGVLARLARSSLLDVEHRHEVSRYRLLDTIRAFAAERLDERGGRQAVLERHLAHHVVLAERSEVDVETAPLDGAVLSVMDDVRAALTWGFDGGAPADAARLAVALRPIWQWSGLVTEGIGWLERARDASATAEWSERARAAGTLANLLVMSGDLVRAEALYHEALAIRRELGSDQAVAYNLMDLGILRFNQGDHEGARQLYDEASRLFRDVGDAYGHGICLLNFAAAETTAGEAARAVSLLREAHAGLAPLGNEFLDAVVAANLGSALIELSNTVEASRQLVGAAHAFLMGGYKGELLSCLSGLAGVARVEGRLHDAAWLLGAVTGLRQDWSIPCAPNELLEVEALRSELDAGLGRMVARQAVDEGRGATPDEALDRAVTAGASVPSSLRWDGHVWHVSFAGRAAQVRDSKGMRDLTRLLGSPGRGIHVLELASPDPELAKRAAGSIGPALDQRAQRAYRQREAELREGIARATRPQDAARRARDEEELVALERELRSSVGLGGRPRPSANAVERARKAVGKRIRADVERLATAHPELGRHLASSVRMGLHCAYEPDPPRTWEIVIAPL